MEKTTVVTNTSEVKTAVIDIRIVVDAVVWRLIQITSLPSRVEPVRPCHSCRLHIRIGYS